jgi:hypothetical protein
VRTRTDLGQQRQLVPGSNSNVEKKQGDRVFGLLQGVEQGAVIGESQVLAKPN